MLKYLLNNLYLKKGAMSLPLFLILSLVIPNGISQPLSLSIDKQFFHYQEFSDDGSVLNSEKGWLYGPLIRYEHQYDSGFDLTLSASLLKGSVAYKGRTQAGKNHDTNTQENIQRLNAGLLYWATPIYRVGINVEEFIWDRDIKPNLGVLGLHETYSWFARSFNQSLRLGNLDISLSIGELLRGNIKVDLSEINKGVIDVPLKPGVQVEFGINYKKNISGRVYLYTQVVGLWRYFKKSDAVRSGSSLFTEPESETIQAGGALGILYVF
jgi:hypothetical protein